MFKENNTNHEASVEREKNDHLNEKKKEEKQFNTLQL